MRTLRAGDMLLKRPGGEPYEGKVWPGATVFPDFTLERTRQCWGKVPRTADRSGRRRLLETTMNDPVLRIRRSLRPAR